jgi:thiol-disulfide isomerase/thioredoxin
MTHPSPLHALLRAPHGRIDRRTLLTLTGIAAAGAGALLAWRHSAAPRPDASSTQPTAASSAAAAIEAASAPVVNQDQLTASFWTQSFDRPDGRSLSLAAYQGKPLLINFWATWCPPCVKELPELERFHREFGPKGWTVLGLAIDTPSAVKAFLPKVGVGFDIGLAGFGGTELAQALGNASGGLPFSVLIDAKGRVQHRKMGATHFQELADWARQTA